ncbi:hypothetical protein MRX96_028672 [Rhipicephalus microplus]
MPASLDWLPSDVLRQQHWFLFTSPSRQQRLHGCTYPREESCLPPLSVGGGAQTPDCAAVFCLAAKASRPQICVTVTWALDVTTGGGAERRHFLSRLPRQTHRPALRKQPTQPLRPRDAAKCVTPTVAPAFPVVAVEADTIVLEGCVQSLQILGIPLAKVTDQWERIKTHEQSHIVS